MTDRRFHPANATVAHVSVGAKAGQAETEGELEAIGAPVADLRAAPGGDRDRQLLFGDGFLVLERSGGWAFGQSLKDGYVGYVLQSQLAEWRAPTHFVAVRSTHRYSAPDLKAPEIQPLSFASGLCVVHELAKHFELADGSFVPKPHVRPLAQVFRDPVTVAQLFFGTPYLWGGNSAWGIDCSGLVQAAVMATGSDCPPDSDLQAGGLGDEIPPDADILRGDLFFWKGHVAMAVDNTTLIHANGHHMAAAYESASSAIARIEAQEGLPLLLRRRL